MTTFKAMVAASILFFAHVGAVFAQVDRTGTGGGPLSAEKAPNTTAAGQPNPPIRDVSPTSSMPIKRLSRHRYADDVTAVRICSGCIPPSAANGSSAAELAADTRGRSDVDFSAFKRAAEARKQPDLDTFVLASAHRERAESMQEKTNGLWQSWVVSVCDGCGDQKPAKALKVEDWPNRNIPLTTGSLDQKAPPPKVNHGETKRVEVRHHGSLEADLSPGNVDSIRRMPQQ